jgi:hypothetical protein
MAAFVSMKDRKARAALIRLAEQYADSEPGGIIAFCSKDD